ncbi:hypothetical protein FRC15_010961 [Serendipita sp. 397]|nr:hypothetical protein FRC15_010961 [Serendipita sp. 397]
MKTLLTSVALAFALGVSAQSGSGVTTRYWDCCKPSCAWSGKAAVSSPVRTCNSQQQVISDANTKSGCDGGTAFTCANNQPWAVSNTLAYGFAAVKLSGYTESQWCCQCYQLTFTSGPASGKVMIVQATNTGGDLGSNHFDILMPGGGVGLFNGCTAQYGSWNGGAQYGGVSSKSQCANLPSIVQSGCNWRFDWFSGSDNPSVNWKAVQCPSALTSISGCTRNSQAGGAPGTGGSTGGGGTTSTSRSSGGGGGSGAPLYGQCGGTGWTGPTTCAQGTCKVSNRKNKTLLFSSVDADSRGLEYYSQCLP